MADNNVTLTIGSQNNTSADFDALKARLDELKAQRAEITIDTDDKDAVAKLAQIDAKIAALDAKTAKPSITVPAAAKAEADIASIDLALDRLSDKNATPDVDLKDDSFNRQLDEDKAKLDAFGASNVSPGISLGGVNGIAGIAAGITALLPALPGALTGAAAGVGTLGLAFEGISPVLSAYSAKTAAAATASQGMGASAASAAAAIKQAQQAVSAAETQEAHDTITAAEAIKNAQEGVAEAEQTAAQNRISAEQAVVAANYNEQQAVQALTAARAAAVLQIQQLNDAEADTALGAKQAQLNLQQAQLNQQQVDASSTSTSLQKEQAALSVAEAEQALTEAQQARTNASKAANQADKEGVEGSPGVVAAKHAVQQAELDQANAQKALVQAEVSGAQSIAKAQQSLADAERSASWQRAGDALTVSQAQQQLAQAYKTAGAGSSAASSAAAAYAAAMAQLTPAGRGVVTEITGMEGALHKLEGISLGALAPGLDTFLKGVQSIIPEIGKEVGAMGGIIGKGLADAGKVMESSGFQKTLQTLFNEGNKFMTVLGPAVGQFVQAFMKMGAGSGSALSGVTTGIVAILNGVDGLFKTLTKYSGPIGQFWAILGQAIGALGPLWGTVIGTLVEALDPLLKAALPVFVSLVGQVGKILVAAQPGLVALSKAAGQILTALAPLVPVMGQFLVTGLKPMTELITALTPLFTDLIEVLALLVRYALVPAMDATNALNGIIADAIGWVVTLVSSLAGGWAAIYAAIKTAWGDIESFFKTFWDNQVTFFKDVVSDVEKIYKDAWDTVWGDIKKTWDTIASFFKGFGGDVEGYFKDAVNWLYSAGKDILSGLWNGITKIWGTVSSWFSGLGSTIGGWFSKASGWLTSAGKDVIGGLFSGIKTALSDIGSWVSNNIVDPIINAVKKFFGINSPSTVMAGIGGHLVSGLIKGLVTGSQGIGSVIHSVFGSMPEALLNLLKKGLIGASGLPAKALDALKGLGGDALSFLKSLGGDAASLWDDLFGSPSSGGTSASSNALGGLPANWHDIASYLYDNGFTKFGAAGVAGNIYAESGGNPEILEAGGGGGGGLIQWTPWQKAGNIITGNYARDLAAQLKDILTYGNGMAIANRGTSPSNAAALYQDNVERPASLTASLPTRMASANAVAYAMGWGKYDTGGWLPTGTSIAVNNTGRPERVVGPNEQSPTVTLQIDPAGASAFEQFMVTSLKYWVRIKGGGNVQQAFGRN